MRGITDDERDLLTQISRFGSDGYPVSKCGSRHWTWGPWRSVNGPPTVFKTRREAVASFERFLDVLREASGELAQARAQAIAALPDAPPEVRALLEEALG